jgi:hypothetical protein
MMYSRTTSIIIFDAFIMIASSSNIRGCVISLPLTRGHHNLRFSLSKLRAKVPEHLSFQLSTKTCAVYCRRGVATGDYAITGILFIQCLDVLKAKKYTLDAGVLFLKKYGQFHNIYSGHPPRLMQVTFALRVRRQF